jgi:hypothetical protein
MALPWPLAASVAGQHTTAQKRRKTECYNPVVAAVLAAIQGSSFHVSMTSPSLPPATRREWLPVIGARAVSESVDWPAEVDK